MVAPGADFSGEVRIARRDGKPWVLKGTDLRSPSGDSSKPEIKFEATRSEKGDAQTIKVTGKAPDQPGFRYSGELVLSTDVPGEETVRVRVMLTVRPNNAASPGAPGFNPSQGPQGPAKPVVPTKGNDSGAAGVPAAAPKK